MFKEILETYRDMEMQKLRQMQRGNHLFEYKNIAPEVAEIIRAASAVIPSLKPPQPIEILLADRYVKDDYFDYIVSRLIADREEITPALICTTLDNLSRDRCRRSFSYWWEPFKFQVNLKATHYVFRVEVDKEQKKCMAIPYKHIGLIVGKFRIEPATYGMMPYWYSVETNGRKRSIQVGDKLEVLTGGIWHPTELCRVKIEVEDNPYSPEPTIPQYEYYFRGFEKATLVGLWTRISDV
jgi:hypothetical protein